MAHGSSRTCANRHLLRGHLQEIHQSPGLFSTTHSTRCPTHAAGACRPTVRASGWPRERELFPQRRQQEWGVGPGWKVTRKARRAPHYDQDGLRAIIERSLSSQEEMVREARLAPEMLQGLYGGIDWARGERNGVSAPGAGRGEGPQSRAPGAT